MRRHIRRRAGWRRKAEPRDESDRVDPPIERVAGGAHGADEVLVAAVIERFAQAADVHIDGAKLDLGVASPDRIEQLLAREHAAGPLEEEARSEEHTSELQSHLNLVCRLLL